MGIPGAPALPATGQLIAIPSHWRPIWTLLESKSQTTPSAPLSPFQSLLRCEMPSTPTFAFQPETFLGAFPESPTALEYLGRVQDHDLYRFRISPVQSLPGELRYLRTLRGNLTFEQAPLKHPNSTTPLMKQYLASIAEIQVEDPPAVPPSARLLVIADDALTAPLTRFANWKRSRGIQVDLVAAQDCGGDRTGIFNCIRTRFESNARPDFVLLVGGNSTVPTFIVPVGWQRAATDYPYSILTASDDIPDVFLGRWPAENIDEVETFIDRTIAYERNDAGGNWAENLLTVASREGSSPTDEQYASQIEKLFTQRSFKAQHLRESNVSATPSNISASLSEGKGWVAYFGHGSGSAWISTIPDFDLNSIRALDNPLRIPVVIDVACDNASWTSNNDCFAKTWVTHQVEGKPAGAVAFYGGSIKVSWHEPAVMSVGIADYHFRRKISALGPSTLAGQIYLFEKMGLNSATLNNLKAYNLFGDPSLGLQF